jgi:glutathione S-transferase
VRAHPLMERWHAEAAAEPDSWRLDKYEDPA